MIGSEFYYVKNGVNLPMDRKFEFVCPFSDFFYDFEWSVPSVIKFLGGAGSVDIGAVQVNLVSGLELRCFGTVCIIVLGHFRSGSIKRSLRFLASFPHPIREHLCCFCLYFSPRFSALPKVNSKITEEGTCVGGRVFSIVITKFR